jgi:hypothetical protein
MIIWLVNNELEMMWKEAVAALLSQHLPGGTEKNHHKPQPG